MILALSYMLLSTYRLVYSLENSSRFQTRIVCIFNVSHSLYTNLIVKFKGI